MVLRNVFKVFSCRRGRICLLSDIEGDSKFEEKVFRFRLFLLVLPTLVMLFTWHFYNKVVLVAFHNSVKGDIAVFRGGDFFVVFVLVGR